MFRLLIADDETATRKGISALISRQSLPLKIIGTASDGMDALSVAGKECPDILLTDVRMPKVDGIALAKACREMNPKCQIIFISGYSDKEYLKSAISLHAVGYVEKPFEDGELIDALQNAIRLISNKPDSVFASEDLQLRKSLISVIKGACSDSAYSSLSAQYPQFFSYRLYCPVLCRFVGEIPAEFSESGFSIASIPTWDSKSIRLLTADVENDTVVLLLSSNRDTQEAFRICVAKIFDVLKDKIHESTRLFISVGRIVNQVQHIPDSYSNAANYLSNLIFFGNENIHFASAGEKSGDNSTNSLLPSYCDFADALRSGNQTLTQSILDKTFANCKKRLYGSNLNLTRDIYYKMLSILSEICEERGFTAVFSHGEDFIWKTVSHADTLENLHAELSRKTELFYMNLSNRSGSSLLVYQIQSYIGEHFCNPDLSILKISEDLHFSSPYLCQVFKNETGKTLNTYINAYRIERAKELLKIRDARLFEICIKVGYRDPNYFTKQFKKHTGLTPSEYREKFV